MFSVTKQIVNLFSVINRRERKDGEIDPGSTLIIEITGPNTLLDKLDDGFRSSLYGKPLVGEYEQESLIDDHLPRLKHLDIGIIPWRYVGAGYRVVLGGGLSERTDICLIKCELIKFKIACKDGGTVKITFNINCQPSIEEAGQLYGMNGHDLELTLEPPSAEEQAQIELDSYADDDNGDEPESTQKNAFNDDFDDVENSLAEALDDIE